MSDDPVVQKESEKAEGASTPSVPKAGAVEGYQRFWDMPYGGTASEKHIPKGFSRFAVGFVRAIMQPLFRFTVDHRERLKALNQQSGVVVIANHTSFLDVIFIYLSIYPPIWPRFIARDSLFSGKPRLLAWALARLGVLPIKRDSADRTAIKRASKCLKNHEVIAIMPEGTRRGKSDRLPELHGGAALIARMGHAPILPMTIRNAELIKQKGKLIHFPKVTAEFGKPILVSDFDFLPKEERLDGCIWYAMRECFALSEQCAPNEVDMNALFPGSRDFTEVFAAHPIPIRDAEEIQGLEQEG